MLRPVTCTMLQKQPESTWNLSRLGHGEKAGGPRTTSTKIPLAADETWHTLCDVVSGLRVTMRILSNTGDHTAEALQACCSSPSFPNPRQTSFVAGQSWRLAWRARPHQIQGLDWPFPEAGGVERCEGREDHFDFFPVDVILREASSKCCWVTAESFWMLASKSRAL